MEYKVSGSPHAISVFIQFHHSPLNHITLYLLSYSTSPFKVLKMQILTIFAILTSVCAPFASARCFSTGEHWGDHADAKSKLDDACNVMQGNFAPGQTKSECRNAVAFKAFNFELQNQKEQDQYISKDDCIEYISREIDNCGHGGEETVGNIRFRFVNECNAVEKYCSC